MRRNARPGVARRRTTLALLFALLAAAGTAAAADAADAPRDVLAAAEDLAPAPVAGGGYDAPRDSFAGAEEYLPFPPAEVTFDAWATPGDRSPYLPFPPAVADGTFDELGAPGDEEESYGRRAAYAGGYGAGDKRCVILMYHRFRAFPSNPYEVSHADFEAQMEYIAQNGYVVIPIDLLVDAIERQDPDILPPRAVVITVDDGFRCVHDYAWTVFRDYDFPFAVYLYTNYIGTGGQAMSWAEIRDMANDELVTIGAHSVSHANLANRKKHPLDYDGWLWNQLVYPKQLLETETNRPVRTFAWPYGTYNGYALDAAVRAGYEGILTVAPGPNDLSTPPFQLRRYGVYWHTSLATFALMLEGRQVPDEEEYYKLAGKSDDDEFLIP